MTGVITFENVTFLIAMVGVLFGVYHFFRNPDIKNDKAVSLLKEELDSAKEISQMAIKTTQNDVHTLCGGIDLLQNKMNEVEKQVVKLGTIIEERLPKK